MLSSVYTCEHDVRVISMEFANHLSIFRRAQRMFAAQWERCSYEFLFSSMFAGRFSYLANNFHVTASAAGLLLPPGSLEVRGKINFPNLFASVHTALKLHRKVITLGMLKKSIVMDYNR